MKISKHTLIHYLLIYILISYQGAPIIVLLGTDFFYGGVLVICGIYVFQRKRLHSYLAFIILLFACMSFALVSARGSLSIASCLSLITRFLIVVVAIDYDNEMFLKRFLNVTCLIALVSIGFFTIYTIFGHGILSSLYSHMYTIQNESGYVSHGLFLVRIRPGYMRNTGLFGEPGQYAALLVPALYLMFFRTDGFYEKKEYIIRSIILLVAILTCQSTAGYIALLGILIILVGSKEENARVTKVLVCVLGIGMLIFTIKSSSDMNFIQVNFINKLFNQSGQFDLSTSSGSARMEGLENVITIYKQYPKAIWGLGTESNIGFSTDTCSGFLNILIIYGLIAFIVLHTFLFSSAFRYRSNIFDFLGKMYIFISICMSQPNILFASLVLLMLYERIMCNYRITVWDENVHT